MEKFICGVLLGLIGGWIIASFIWSPVVNRWMGAWESATARADYYAHGVIDRDLVRICEWGDVTGVWFKEDCENGT